MPVISRIGRKSWTVRAVVGAIYVVLAAGAVTMVYPFLLMLTGSTRSEADSVYISPVPRFWFQDLVLFQKYVESKHNVVLADAEAAWGQRIGSWRSIEPPPPSPHLDDFLAWRSECPGWRLGHTGGGRLLPVNARLYRQRMYERFGGSIEAYRSAMKFPATGWQMVLPPAPPAGRYPPPPDALRQEFDSFAAARPVEDRVLPNLDGEFRRFLARAYTEDIEAYNRAHGTSLRDYREVFLAERAPPQPRQREDWEQYIREIAPLRFLRLDPALAGGFRKYLAARVYRSIDELNARYGTTYDSFDAVPLPAEAPGADSPLAAVDWAGFVKDREHCPADGIAVHGPRQMFEAFVATRRGVPVDRVGPIDLPVAQADWHDCLARRGELRSEFTTRNYRHVLEYIALHGRGVVNTLVYCALAIAAALLVNPLAAYALSRFKPPSTYKVLLLCMATMAFPAEVTMIPAFLLMKRFPLWPLVAGAVATAAALWLIWRACPRWPEALRAAAAVAVGLTAGVWAVPAVTERPFISLLNTFAALVLPGAASGFFIFLLKGFFDSLPRELYEAADIDGAGEWTKFWTITMGLSTPILAVIALNAFTAAYSAFMMALIIIPDQEMWTLMVWIFQLQTQSHEGVVYASIVLAAIPTFLVFLLCQNVILRGIVVPTEK